MKIAINLAAIVINYENCYIVKLEFEFLRKHKVDYHINTNSEKIDKNVVNRLELPKQKSLWNMQKKR